MEPSLSSLSDAELVFRTLKGDNRGFEVLVVRYLQLVIGYMHFLNVPKDLVEDFVQESFMKAFLNLNQFDPSRSFLPWIFSIARNSFLDKWRKDSKTRNSLVFSLSGQTSSFEDQVIAAQSIQELIENLPEDARFLFELRLVKKFSFAQIAELTGEAEPTLRMRVHRLLSRLRLEAKKVGLNG